MQSTDGLSIYPSHKNPNKPSSQSAAVAGSSSATSLSPTNHPSFQLLQNGYIYDQRAALLMGSPETSLDQRWNASLEKPSEFEYSAAPHAGLVTDGYEDFEQPTYEVSTPSGSIYLIQTTPQYPLGSHPNEAFNGQNDSHGYQQWSNGIPNQEIDASLPENQDFILGDMPPNAFPPQTNYNPQDAFYSLYDNAPSTAGQWGGLPVGGMAEGVNSGQIHFEAGGDHAFQQFPPTNLQDYHQITSDAQTPFHAASVPTQRNELSLTGVAESDATARIHDRSSFNVPFPALLHPTETLHLPYDASYATAHPTYEDMNGGFIFNGNLSMQPAAPQTYDLVGPPHDQPTQLTGYGLVPSISTSTRPMQPPAPYPRNNAHYAYSLAAHPQSGASDGAGTESGLSLSSMYCATEPELSTDPSLKADTSSKQLLTPPYAASDVTATPPSFDVSQPIVPCPAPLSDPYMGHSLKYTREQQDLIATIGKLFPLPSPDGPLPASPPPIASASTTPLPPVPSTDPPPRRGRGRPRGSKNKIKKPYAPPPPIKQNTKKEMVFFTFDPMAPKGQPKFHHQVEKRPE